MRSRWRLSSTAAMVVSGLLALTGAESAFAQKAPGKPAAAKKAPAKKAPAKGAAKAPAKGAKKAPGKVAKGPKPMSAKQKKDAARKAYKEGEAKFKEGAYQAAFNAYKEADELLPIAATKYKMAVCHDKLGNVVEAVAAYQVFLDASPDPKKMDAAIADAKARVTSLKKTPGKVRVAFEPADAPKPMLSVDGAAPQPAILADVRPAPDAAPVRAATVAMAPGHHKITATAEGFDPATTELDLNFAETRDVKVTLNPMPPPPPPVASNEPPPPPPPPPPAPRSNVPAYVTLGLAGAGAIVGGIFGGLALKAKSDFNKDPTTENADKTDRNALICDMSFAVALTFGVTGAVLLLSNDSPAAEQKAAAAPKNHKKVQGFITPYWSPQGGGAAALVTF